MHRDNLSILTITLLFSFFMTVVLRHCVVENLDWTLWLNFYFQRIYVALSKTCDISTTNTDWRMIAATLTYIDADLAEKQRKGCFFMGHLLWCAVLEIKNHQCHTTLFTTALTLKKILPFASHIFKHILQLFCCSNIMFKFCIRTMNYDNELRR